MAFEDFSMPPRFALDCRRWADGGAARRHGAVAGERQAQVKSEDRQRQIRKYAADKRCSQAEAERDLYEGEDEP